MLADPGKRGTSETKTETTGGRGRCSRLSKALESVTDLD